MNTIIYNQAVNKGGVQIPKYNLLTANIAEKSISEETPSSIYGVKGEQIPFTQTLLVPNKYSTITNNNLLTANIGESFKTARVVPIKTFKEINYYIDEPLYLFNAVGRNTYSTN